MTAELDQCRTELRVAEKRLKELRCEVDKAALAHDIQVGVVNSLRQRTAEAAYNSAPERLAQHLIESLRETRQMFRAGNWNGVLVFRDKDEIDWLIECADAFEHALRLLGIGIPGPVGRMWQCISRKRHMFERVTCPEAPRSARDGFYLVQP